MIGERWTYKTPIVRLSFVAPLILVVFAPRVCQASGLRISLAGAIGGALVVVAWIAFVAWRLAINANRQGRLFGDPR
ncbi:hypothetical protein BH10PSE14_BH10PSE14_29020 [soil metagenome]